MAASLSVQLNTSPAQRMTTARNKASAIARPRMSTRFLVLMSLMLIPFPKA